MARIYLDHAATTPMRPEAIAAVTDGMTRWANPSSPHAEGRAARAALEDARRRIATALDWPHHVILTSGASEAIALAFRGRADVHMLAVEHDAVLRAGQGTIVPVGSNGLAGPLPSGSIAIQSANSETGVLQNAERTPDTLLLRDCSQTAGKLPLPDADLIVVSAHKLGGPPSLCAETTIMSASGSGTFPAVCEQSRSADWGASCSTPVSLLADWIATNPSGIAVGRPSAPTGMIVPRPARSTASCSTASRGTSPRPRSPSAIASLAPLVRMTWCGQSSAAAIRRRASSSAARAARPSACGEDGFAQRVMPSATAAIACGRIGVVAAWSR